MTYNLTATEITNAREKLVLFLKEFTKLEKKLELKVPFHFSFDLDSNSAEIRNLDGNHRAILNTFENSARGLSTDVVYLYKPGILGKTVGERFPTSETESYLEKSQVWRGEHKGKKTIPYALRFEEWNPKIAQYLEWFLNNPPAKQYIESNRTISPGSLSIYGYEKKLDALLMCGIGCGDSFGEFPNPAQIWEIIEREI